MHLYSLVIEITRQCNMSCEHCLRGEPENITITLGHIGKMFSRINSVSSLTITGGEPSLHPEIITDIVRLAKKYCVAIGNFYIVTNAKKTTVKFVQSVIALYDYCYDNEISELAISGDDYHDSINSSNVDLLHVFRFTSYKEEPGTRYDDRLLSEGRAELSGQKEIEFSSFEIDDDDYINEGDVYLNCLGDVLPSCDLSYESQREPALILGNVQDNDFNLLAAIKQFNAMLDGQCLKKGDVLYNYDCVHA